MHARSGAFELSIERVDEALEAFRENFLPRYKDQHGYKGFTLLANRQTGRLMGISFWESEADLQASDELGDQARADLQERGSGEGTPERVDWEVVLADTA